MTFSPRLLHPAESAPPPLAMPDQVLSAPFTDPEAPGTATGISTRRLRALVLVSPLVITAGLAWAFAAQFAANGRLGPVEWALVGATALAVYWVVLSVVTATLGLFWRPKPVAHPLHGVSVAILLPMYGEPAQQTIGHAVQLLAGVAGRGRHSFSLHILSDTRSPIAAAAEEATATTLRRQHPGLEITYRRRPQNTDYKSGNIRDWVQTRGAAHDAMLILDADSIMGPQTVFQMADALAQDPGLGLIQTVPRVLPGHTVWQGLQSLASEVYGVNMGRGFALWTGAEGNFLGHNALVRTRAFAASAGLPHLPGAAPRGGVILSHDFVEAALLRRAGWGVRMMPQAEDSFEDTPETLIGYLKRDQRWCQGNLQHLRLLRTPGLHPVSRFHLLQGAMSYLASVFWLALLILWALPAPPQTDAPNLIAQPLISQGAMAALIGGLLLAPKLLGLAAYLRRHPLSLRAALRFAGLVLAEVLVSILLAPAFMVHQVRAVLRTFCGLDGGWMPHVAGRSDLRTLLRFHGIETALGLGLVAASIAGYLSLWLLPFAISLCLTVPLAALMQLPRAVFHRAAPRPMPR